MGLLRRGWALSLVCFAGCFGQGSANESASVPVAIVDLDEIARRIGRDTVMANSVAAQTRNLNSQLKTLQDGLRRTLSEKEKSVGQTGQSNRSNNNLKGAVRTPQISDADLDQLRQEANLRLNRAQRKAQAAISKHRLALIRKFRKEAMDYVKDVAREKGIKIVLTNNDSVVFMFEDPVDLTAQVAKRMKADAAQQPVQKTATRKSGKSNR